MSFSMIVWLGLLRARFHYKNRQLLLRHKSWQQMRDSSLQVCCDDKKLQQICCNKESIATNLQVVTIGYPIKTTLSQLQGTQKNNFFFLLNTYDDDIFNKHEFVIAIGMTIAKTKFIFFIAMLFFFLKKLYILFSLCALQQRPVSLQRRLFNRYGLHKK